MQLSSLVLAAALALGVSAQQDNLSEVDGYSAANCPSRNYVETWVTKAGNSVSEDGQCFSFPSNGYTSVKVYQLASNRGCAGAWRRPVPPCGTRIADPAPQ